MNKATFWDIIGIFLLFMATSAQGQPISGQTYMDSQYAIEIYPTDEQLLSSQNPGLYQDQNSIEVNAALQANIEYSSYVPSGAPTPFAPRSPDSLGLQTNILNPAWRSQRESEPGTSSTYPLFLKQLQVADFSAGSPCGCKPPA